MQAQQLILDGQSYPVHGLNGFKRSLISMFPPKLTIGDTNKDDEQFVATWETNVATGGIGLFRMLDRSQTDRAYWSGLNLSYHSGITLPPYVANYGRPTGSVLAMKDGIDFLTHTYVVFGKSIYIMNDTLVDGGTGATNYTAVDTPADNINAVAVWNNKIWIITDNKLRSSADGVTWADDATTLVASYSYPFDPPATTHAQTMGGQFMCAHDGTLWIIKGYDVFKVAAGAWVYQGSIDKIYTIRKLLEYINVAGETSLYAMTSGGAYIADESVTPAVWKLTAFRWPIGTNAGKGSKVWRADLYSYSGLDGYKYTSGSTTTSTVDASIGLSRDGGIPVAYDGAITESADALNDLFVLVDQSLTTQTTEAAYTFRQAGFQYPHYTPRFNYISNFSAYVAQWSGSAWTVPWISPRTPAPIPPGGMFISQNNAYRTYWSWNGDVYAMDLPKGLRNPWQNTISRFQRGPIQHISPWFQGLAESLEKVGLNLKLFLQDMSATETVSVSYGLDFAEGWTPLADPDTGIVPITTNGLHTLRLGPSSATTPKVYNGLEYSAIRFLFEFDRSASDSSKSPSLFYWLHQFQKQFDPRWGFTITLDLTQDYMGRTPAQMVSDLLNLTDKVTLVTMQYKDPASLVTGAYAVKITHVQASEESDLDSRGVWNISVIQPVN